MSDAAAPTAAELRGHGPMGIFATILVVASALLGGWVAAIFVLLWAQASHTPWEELGLAKPKSWVLTALLGLLAGGAFKLLAKSVVLPLLGAGAVNQAYHYLVGNTAALPGLVLYIVVSAAFGEELFYRGFLFERLGKWWGMSVPARVATVLVGAILFALAHLADQGWAGALQALITGLFFGTLYAATRRLWLVMFAHLGFDLTAVWIIYANLETKVAHLLFR